MDFATALGYELSSFLIPAIPAYALLRFAGSPKRARVTAIILRLAAIAIVGFLTYASYIGGGRFGIGAALALVLTLAWAAKQQFSKSPRREV